MAIAKRDENFITTLQGVSIIDGLTPTDIAVNPANGAVQFEPLSSILNKPLFSSGGSAGSSGNNTLVVAGLKRLKVYAFSLSTVSTTAVTCIFQNGASGATLWEVILQTPASVGGGANLVVPPPAWLFATSPQTLLNLNLSAAVTVYWSVSYMDEV